VGGYLRGFNEKGSEGSGEIEKARMCRNCRFSSKSKSIKYDTSFFFFFDMSTQEGREGFDLVTSVS
jgi:hypothetical protein